MSYFCNMADKLPDEMILMIMSHLQKEDRRKSRLVCKRWNRISYDRQLVKDDTTNVMNWEDLDKYSQVTRHVRMVISDIPGPYIESPFWQTHGKHIEFLNIQNFGRNPLAMYQIIKRCQNLKILYLHRIGDDSNTSCQQLFDVISPISLPKLEEVYLFQVEGVNESCAVVLHAILSQSPKLSKLHVEDDEYEKSKLLLPILKMNSGSLKDLDLMLCPLETDSFCETIESIQSQLKRLHVVVDGLPEESRMIEFSEKFVQLEYLELDCCKNSKISSTVIRNIATLFKDLTHLSLQAADISNVSRSAAITFGRMESLTAIRFEHVNVTSENLISMFSTKNLKLTKLLLIECNLHIDRETLLSICPNLPNLFILILDNNSIEEGAFEVICEFNKKLEYLSLTNCLTSPISESVNELKDLADLCLDGCQNLSLSLAPFKLPNLTHIGLEDVEVTEEDVTRMIEGCPKLWRVSLKNNPIESRIYEILEGRRKQYRRRSCEMPT